MRPLAIAVLLLCALPSIARAETFFYSDLLAEETPTAQAVAHMSSLLRDRTKGRHDIQEVPPDVTDTDNFTLAKVQSGKVAMARLRLATFHNSIPEAVVPSFPYHFKSRESLRQVLNGGLGEAIFAKMHDKGLVGLCFYDTGLRSFYAGKPIRTVTDLSDMKIRVQGGDIFGQVLQSIGAVPQQLPFGRIYDALKSGAIDGAELDLVTYVGARHYEHARVYSFTEHAMPPSVLVFSRLVWEKLSENDQKVIKAAAIESAVRLGHLWDQREADARLVLERSKVQLVTDIVKRSFSDAMVPPFSKLIANANLQKWLRDVDSKTPN